MDTIYQFSTYFCFKNNYYSFFNNFFVSFFRCVTNLSVVRLKATFDTRFFIFGNTAPLDPGCGHT
jgi:hypothetical protein